MKFSIDDIDGFNPTKELTFTMNVADYRLNPQPVLDYVNAFLNQRNTGVIQITLHDPYCDACNAIFDCMCGQTS